MSEGGIRKSAILLMSVADEAVAAEVLKSLGPGEVQKVGISMAGLENVTHEEIRDVLHEFRKETENRTSLGMGADDYIRTMMIQALGADKANSLLDRIMTGGDTSGIEGLKWMEAPAVAELIKNEHPQIIATILVHLDHDQASSILGRFVERLRNDVMLRIATLDGIQPHALSELNSVLTELLAGGDRVKRQMGGVKTAAEILNHMGGGAEVDVINNIKEFDAELAQRIQDEMFVFEDIVAIDDRGIQLLLREVQSETLVIALKGASVELRDKIFKNMSARASEMLRDDLEAKGPVRLSEVDTEQKGILKIARRLADEGQIVLAGKSDEKFL
ncbi:MAG: flagellar motor switch protein FliG [Methylophilales bacterium]|nr:flagellar motor switch protein FliG [Methylophilales bacterium]